MPTLDNSPVVGQIRGIRSREDSYTDHAEFHFRFSRGFATASCKLRLHSVLEPHPKRAIEPRLAQAGRGFPLSFVERLNRAAPAGNVPAPHLGGYANGLTKAAGGANRPAQRDASNGVELPESHAGVTAKGSRLVKAYRETPEKNAYGSSQVGFGFSGRLQLRQGLLSSAPV